MTIITCAKCGANNRVEEARAESAVCGKCGAALATGGQELIEVGDGDFETRVLGIRGKAVLVDFWAPWCGPCRMQAPVIEALARESGGNYFVAKVNTDENPRVARLYDISGIPTLIIFKDGRIMDRIVGLSTKEALESKLRGMR